MLEAVCEIRNCSWYDYLIINDDLETAVDETVSVILSERRRVERMLPDVQKRFHQIRL